MRRQLWPLVTCFCGAGVEKYLTVEELADYLRLTVATIRRWVSNRKIPFHKIMGVIRFRLSEIEKWVDEGGLELQEEKPESNGGDLFSGDSLPDEATDMGEAGAAVSVVGGMNDGL